MKKFIIFLLFTTLVPIPFQANAQGDWKIVTTFQSQPENRVSRPEWSPTENLLLITFDRVQGDQAITLTGVYDIENEEMRFEIGSLKLTWSPDGRYLIHIVSDVIEFLSPKSGRVVVRMSNHIGEVSNIVWNSDFSRIATSSDEGTLNVWDADGNLIATSQTEYSRKVIGWSADGKYLAVRSERNILEVFAGLNLSEPILNLYSVTIDPVWHPRNSWLAVTQDYGTVRIWNIENQSVEGSYESLTAPVVQLEWHETGNQLAMYSTNHRIGLVSHIRIWDLAADKIVFEEYGRDFLTVNQFWHGQHFIISDIQGVRIWSDSDYHFVADINYGSVYGNNDISPDGTLLATANSSGSEDGEFPVTLYDLSNGQQQTRLDAHKARVIEVSFSHNGLFVVTSGEYDQIVVWGRE